MGGTPAWAAPNGKRSVYPDNAQSSPPDDLAVLDAYVSALVGRYKGRIAAYELWVLANDARMYTGSVETLVEMTRRERRSSAPPIPPPPWSARAWATCGAPRASRCCGSSPGSAAT